MQANKADVLKRMAYIEGHLRGIRKMIETDQYCVDILKQTYAVKPQGQRQRVRSGRPVLAPVPGAQPVSRGPAVRQRLAPPRRRS